MNLTPEQIRNNAIGEYESFLESSVNIIDNSVRKKIKAELQSGKNWPEPLIQFSYT